MNMFALIERKKLLHYFSSQCFFFQNLRTRNQQFSRKFRRLRRAEEKGDEKALFETFSWI